MEVISIEAATFEEMKQALSSIIRGYPDRKRNTAGGKTDGMDG